MLRLTEMQPVQTRKLLRKEKREMDDDGLQLEDVSDV